MTLCILLPCYNNSAGLAVALRSIHYPAADCLAVVVDDGSALPVEVPADSPVPVQLLRLPQNRGITEALNTGLQWIRAHTDARYIARLDCDDQAAPDRFTRQVAFMDAHPEVGLLGSWCRFESADGRAAYTYRTPTDHPSIKKEMHLRNVFMHPTVLFRAELLTRTGPYPYEFPFCEDYALFWRMLQLSRGAVLPQALTVSRISPGGLSMANRRAQLEGRRRVVRAFADSRWWRLLGLLRLSLLEWTPDRLAGSLKKVRK